MRGLVLAAGRGSRIGPATAGRPKAFLELEGATLFTRQAAALSAAGAEEVAIVTGWSPGHAGATGHPTFHNPSWDVTTMVASLAAADAWLSSGPVLVCYGDILVSAGAARVVAAAQDDIVLGYDPDWFALWSARMDDPLSDAESFRLDASGAVCDIGRRGITRDDAQGQYVGLFLLRPPGWRALSALLEQHDPDGTELDVTGLLRVAIGAGVRISAVAIPGPWCEIDTARDLDVARRVARELDARPQ